jgi:hypothetical protein
LNNHALVSILGKVLWKLQLLLLPARSSYKFTKLDEQNYTILSVGTIEMKDNKVIVLVD